jgi:hypothetical protein
VDQARVRRVEQAFDLDDVDAAVRCGLVVTRTGARAARIEEPDPERAREAAERREAHEPPRAA